MAKRLAELHEDVVAVGERGEVSEEQRKECPRESSQVGLASFGLSSGARRSLLEDGLDGRGVALEDTTVCEKRESQRGLRCEQRRRRTNLTLKRRHADGNDDLGLWSRLKVSEAAAGRKEGTTYKRRKVENEILGTTQEVGLEDTANLLDFLGSELGVALGESLLIMPLAGICDGGKASSEHRAPRERAGGGNSPMKLRRLNSSVKLLLSGVPVSSDENDQ